VTPTERQVGKEVNVSGHTGGARWAVPSLTQDALRWTALFLPGLAGCSSGQGAGSRLLWLVCWRVWQKARVCVSVCLQA
jgi:hypothetical protein